MDLLKRFALAGAMAVPVILAHGTAFAQATSPVPQGDDPLAQDIASEPGAADSAEHDTIDGTNALNRITVPVHFEGSGPYPFLVDTGSETTVLSTELAAELGLVASGNRPVAGGIARADVGLIGATRFTVGRHAITSEQAILLDAQHLGAAGVLGIESLRKYRVVFDFGTDKINITRTRIRHQTDFEQQADGRAFEITVRAKRMADRMVLTSADVDGVPVKVIIDTGSNVSIANFALLRRLSTARSIGHATILDVTGAQAWREVFMASTFRMGPIVMGQSAFIISDSPAFEALGLSGKPAILLGMNHLRAFRRISVDFARREVSFDLKG